MSDILKADKIFVANCLRVELSSYSVDTIKTALQNLPQTGYTLCPIWLDFPSSGNDFVGFYSKPSDVVFQAVLYPYDNGKNPFYIKRYADVWVTKEFVLTDITA